MPAQLASVADGLIPNWRNRAYNKYTFSQVEVAVDPDGTIKMDVNLLGESVGYHDVVYWAKGDLWPFYVKTDQGEALLIRYTSAH